MKSNFYFRNRRGGIASFLSFFGATIFIILLLGLYIFGGSVIKKFNHDAASGEMVLQDEEDVGLANIFTYNEDYSNLTKVKVLVSEGNRVKDAISEAGYEE